MNGQCLPACMVLPCGMRPARHQWDTARCRRRCTVLSGAMLQSGRDATAENDSPSTPILSADDAARRRTHVHVRRPDVDRGFRGFLRDGDLTFALSLAFSRLVVGLLITQIGLTIFPRGPFAMLPSSRMSGFLSWDGTWYLGLANGYPGPRDTVFFPGYPVAVHLVQMTFGNRVSLEAVGFGISWAAFILSAPVVLALTRQLCSRKAARLAVVLYVWSPASVFLLAAYPVSCFVLFSAAALLCLRKDWLLAAALLAGLSTAFSAFGVCVAVAVGISALRGRSISNALMLTAASVWGITAWVVWLTIRFHDPLVFVTQQKTFNRRSVPPFSGLVGVIVHFGDTRGTPLGLTAGNFAGTKSLNLAFALLSLAMFIYYVVDLVSTKLRRFPPYFSVFAALSFLLPSLSIQTFAGVPNPEAATRHATGSVGLYPALSLLLLRKRWLLSPVLSLWISLAVVFQLVFSLGWYFT